MGDITYTDLSAVELFQKYAQGSTHLNSVLANTVLTLPNNMSQPDTTVLTLGSTGDVQFIVRGREDVGKLSVDDDDIFNFTSTNAMWISGNDCCKSVGVSRTLFTYDAAKGKNKIDAGNSFIEDGIPRKRNFEFDCAVCEFTGSTQIDGDFIANGHVIAQSVNVGFVEDNNVSIGYGFRVTDKHTLELYKYDRSNSYTQRIATFGEGDVKKNDAFSNFPVFAASNYEAYDQLTLGDSYAPLWSTECGNLWYNDGKVAVGTSNFNSNQNYTLEVAKTLFVDDGIHIGTAGVQIQHNDITAVNKVVFENESSDIQFDGKLSSLRLDFISDYDNTTWLRKFQNTIPLSGFNNDLNLTNFYTGTDLTWFDRPQDTIKLSLFDNDIVSADVMDFNTVNVDTIQFMDNPESNLFKGEISQLAGIPTFNLTNFNDDIVTKSQLSIASLSVDAINDDIVPASHDTLTVGRDDVRYSTAYLTSLNVGVADSNATVTYDVATDTLNIDKPIIASQGISLADGSTLTSVGKEGGSFNDFDYVKLSFFNGIEVFNISGQFNFGADHDKVGSELYTLYIYNIDNGDYNILLPDEEGNVSTSNMTLVHTQNSKYLDFDMFYEDGQAIATGSLYITPYSPQDANELINMHTLVPDTLEFKQKFKADFDYFNNDRMSINPDDRTWSVVMPWGYITGELNLFDYVKYIKSNASDVTDATNKFLVEYISYYSLPFDPQNNSLLASYDEAFFVVDNMQDRLDGLSVYKQYDDVLEDFVALQDNTFALYPKITFKKWKNTSNDSTVSLTPYSSYVGWYDPNTGDVDVGRFSVDWLTKLLELTVSYIKYGAINQLTAQDETDINDKVTAGFSASDFTKISVQFGTGTIENAIIINKDIFTIDNDALIY
jgi:hypothetical protein